MDNIRGINACLLLAVYTYLGIWSSMKPSSIIVFLTLKHLSNIYVNNLPSLSGILSSSYVFSNVQQPVNIKSTSDSANSSIKEVSSDSTSEASDHNLCESDSNNSHEPYQPINSENNLK